MMKEKGRMPVFGSLNTKPGRVHPKNAQHAILGLCLGAMCLFAHGQAALNTALVPPGPANDAAPANHSQHQGNKTHHPAHHKPAHHPQGQGGVKSKLSKDAKQPISPGSEAAAGAPGKPGKLGTMGAVGAVGAVGGFGTATPTEVPAANSPSTATPAQDPSPAANGLPSINRAQALGSLVWPASAYAAIPYGAPMASPPSWNSLLTYSTKGTSANSDGDELIVEMEQAFKKGDTRTLSRLLPQVSKHPLEPWAAYWTLRARLNEASVQEVKDFLSQYAGTYVEDRLRNDWLLLLASRRDWTTFAEQYPMFRMRDDRELQCYGLMVQWTQSTPTGKTELEPIMKSLWSSKKKPTTAARKS